MQHAITIFTAKPGRLKELADNLMMEYVRNSEVTGPTTDKLFLEEAGNNAIHIGTYDSKSEYEDWIKSDLRKHHLDQISHLLANVETSLYEPYYSSDS